MTQLASDSQFQALQYRLVGPHRGGRVVAVAGHPTNPLLFYFGSTGGGVWKTEDAGVSWRNISDGYFQRASVGAIAVAESDPNVIYVGMGETAIRGNVAHGDGVYKSTDGGRTWAHMGLAASQSIGKIRIHPTNPDLVYVSAFGHVYGPNPERGIFRSQDGGKSWSRILFRDEQTGAIDLVMDPTNPRILYAALWHAWRKPWSLCSGGPGTGIFKSTDGGDTWQELTQKPGLPQGLIGKIGLAVSPARPDRIFACIEAEEGGIFRSDDAGATWTRLNEERTMRQRAWYFTHVIADPVDAETVYVLNVQFWKSIDGGKNFTSVPTPHADNHDLWIDPRQPQRMILGNDGGATITLNGMQSWSTQYNQPTAEFYHVSTDNRFPYRIYGSQQDNTSMSIASRSDRGGITAQSWHEVGGGESGYIATRPDNPDIVYAGSYGGYLTRYDHQSQQAWNISVWPELHSGQAAKEVKYRFQWTYPIVLSPFDPNTLYVTGNHVFRSTNEGLSWDVISPDLTGNDASKLEASGGPITKDGTSVEFYCTIFSFAESPVERGVLWAGSDDGLIHVSRNGGQTWQNVTPPNLPEWALISMIDASHHHAGTAYVAATRYKLDDFRPYILKTHDYGQTWTMITDGLPADIFVRVVREDTVRPGLLYAGLENGLYVSLDDGASWQSLQRNLPVVPIHDLEVKGDDLVVGTHGRAFWVLDDLSVLRQWGDQATGGAVHLFAPKPTVRTKMPFLRYFPEPGLRDYAITGGYVVQVDQAPDGTPTFVDAGMNPADGVYVHYFLREQPVGEVKLRFLDADGALIREFSSKPSDKAPKDGKKNPDLVPARAGSNRFVWNMNYPDATAVPGTVLRGASLAGPTAPPGRYQVQLVVGDQTYTQSFDILKDSRSLATVEEMREQFDLHLQVHRKLSATHEMVNQLRDLREQVQWWAARAEGTPAAGAVGEAAKAIKEQLSSVEDELIQWRARTSTDFLHFGVRLNNKLAALGQAVATGERKPSRQSYELFADISARVDREAERFAAVVQDGLAAFNELLRAHNLGLIAVKQK